MQHPHNAGMQSAGELLKIEREILEFRLKPQIALVARLGELDAMLEKGLEKREAMLEILYYIFIFPVEQVLEWALFTLFKATKNYGVSIILLSLIMQLFMLKLTFYFDKKAASFSER